ncbi:MAG: protein-L-isoaspartate(D-aspartate) O-methyltransferase [Hyphomicrobiaceae bacterium]
MAAFHQPKSSNELVAALRRRGIGDERVLAAMARVPRDRFVPADLVEEAWWDVALPLHEGQTISQPFIVAYMTAALRVEPHHSVLEIGTGSGYQAAVLSHLSRQVHTIERYASLHEEAIARFAALGITNITARVGDGREGWPEAAPFDRIMVTAAARELPRQLMDQLAPGGIMVLPLGARSEEQYLYRLRRTGEPQEAGTGSGADDEGGGFRQERLLPVRFVPLL